jgi:hypothetical protein
MTDASAACSSSRWKRRVSARMFTLSPRRRSQVASEGFLGRVCAAWNGLRSVRHGRANDHGGEKRRTEPVGTLGLWCPPPRPPPPDPSSEAKQSQTADDQLKRWRHLPGVLHEEIDGRLCADRRRGCEDQEQRQEGARAPHVAIKAQSQCQMLPEISLTRHSEKPRTSPTQGTDIALSSVSGS